jgi:hypothetical protein
VAWSESDIDQQSDTSRKKTIVQAASTENLAPPEWTRITDQVTARIGVSLDS